MLSKKLQSTIKSLGSQRTMSADGGGSDDDASAMRKPAAGAKGKGPVAEAEAEGEVSARAELPMSASRDNLRGRQPDGDGPSHSSARLEGKDGPRPRSALKRRSEGGTVGGAFDSPRGYARKTVASDSGNLPPNGASPLKW